MMTSGSRPTMRVLQLITRRQRRGAEVFASELADALAGRGHDVLLAGIYDPRGAELRPERAAWADLGGSPGGPLNPMALARVARAIRTFRPDVVQANGSDTLKYSVLARLASRGRWRLVYRNISVASRWLRGSTHAAWNRWLTARTDHIVAVSRTLADDFSRTYEIEPTRISTIPQSVRVPGTPATDRARQTVARLTGIGQDTPLLVHVGSFTPEKNHAWLLDAFDRIRRSHPRAHLVLIGDGVLRSNVQERIGHLDLLSCVHLLGSRPDASELVAAADVLVLPSLVEGLPGVVLEAAAQSVPAVANDVGGVHEAIHDGDTGLVVQAGNMDAFVSAVSTLLRDPALSRAMGARARALMKREYELDAAVLSYEQLYLRLLGQPAVADPAVCATLT